MVDYYEMYKMKAYALSFNESSILDQWDSGFLLDMLEQMGIKPIPVKRLEKAENAIVIIPARHHKGMEKEIQKELDKITNCVFFAMGDEEAEFDVHKIKANHIWVQNPHPEKHDKYNRIGTGYPPQSQEILPKMKYEKDINVYFSGQITHKRRTEMIDNMIEYELSDKNIIINQTKGFTQGVSHNQYYNEMSRAKVVPCPSGAVIPDSFRLFEALESMAVPLADEVNPSGTITEYWDWLFGESVPFPTYKESDRLVGLTCETLDDWNRIVQKQTCWWILQKRNFKIKISEQLNG